MSIDKLKEVYEDGAAEINGRTYEFGKMVHKQRRKIFSFFTFAQHDLERGDFSFLDSERFEAIEKIISGVVLYDGMQLSKRPDHWEEFPEDYIIFTTTALGVISYPFLRGQLGG